MRTKIAPGEWSFYFPEDGWTREDAVPIIGRTFDAEDAAEQACEYDFSSRDGWERGASEFDVIVISPDGEETIFVCWHEPTVEHMARAKQ